MSLKDQLKLYHWYREPAAREIWFCPIKLYESAIDMIVINEGRVEFYPKHDFRLIPIAVKEGVPDIKDRYTFIKECFNLLGKNII